MTRTALCTFIRSKFQPNQADPVKEAVKSPQRTENSTKRTGDEHTGNQSESQQNELIDKEPANTGPQARVKHKHGDTGFQGSGRAKELTEPGQAHIKIIEQKQGQEHNSYYQDEITAPAKPGRQGNCGRGDTVQPLLKPAKGAGPTTDKTPE
jgi:hypothetical protein